MTEKDKNSLIDTIPTPKTIGDIFVALEKRKTFRAGEISSLGKTFLAHFLSHGTNKKIVFITDNKEMTERHMREWGIDAGFRFDPTAEVRLSVLSLDDVFQKVVSVAEYQSKVIKLAVGDKINLVALADLLTEAGYQRVKKPDSRGEFGIKGDILELFVGEEKVRIEFFGDTIEKIVGAALRGRPDSGAHIGAPLRGINIYPKEIPEGDKYIISYFDNYLFIIDGEDAFRSHVLALFDYEEGALSSDDIKKLKEVEDFVKRQEVIYLEDFSVSEKAGVNLRWLEPKRYAGNTTEFLNYIKKHHGSTGELRTNTYILSEKAEQIQKFLRDNGIGVPKSDIGEFLDVRLRDSSMVVVHDHKISEGISLGDSRLVIFSDKEIFGEEKKRKKRKVDFSALTNLKKGEYVVHVDYGIGVFTGFGEIVVDKIKREYIFIEYSDGDSIYVPLDQADRITKYVAAGNVAPHLSSLKTGQWLKVRKKVQDNAERIAKELIETQALRAEEKPFYYIDDSEEQRILEKTFAYKETKDQSKTISEVLEDMGRRQPMDRIVCGDVGYGKTEVAIRAATRAVISGGQAAILVPTTILAEQHLETFRERLDQFGFRIESLSRFRSAGDQDKIMDRLKSGGVDIVIGTHRLLSKDIKFKKLYLVVIDEEQKFGVKHKERLKKLRAGSDILTMTATPIPRTLYLGLGGLKDISLINTPPEGRKAIKTVVIKNDDEVIKEAITKEVARGGQVYFVHNRVETIRAVEMRLKKLLPRVKFVVGHGQMKDQELAHIMNSFAKQEYQVLICSTIIESGLDISSVNTLIVDKATNFGLSQLHQLRGRIGRSSRQAYAYFLYNSDDLKGNAKRRLLAISEKEALGSGYELSLEDLDIRGSGNILGEEQSGSMQMVGVGYYLKLLEEAVDRIQSRDSGTKSEDMNVKIDLPISAYIPDGFYKKEEDKIRAYQAWAGVEEIDEAEEKERELLTELKLVPEEYKNLIEIVRLKIKARDAGIKSMVVKDVLGMGEQKVKKLYIEFDHVLSKQEVNIFFAQNRHWYFGNMLARINLADLGEDWFRGISTILEAIKK